MYECPNCTVEQEHEIYTCLHCRHVIKQLPTKEEATEIIREAAEEGRVRFETDGTTIDCKCNGCGEEMPITFFKREYDIAEDAGPCGCGGTWERNDKYGYELW